MDSMECTVHGVITSEKSDEFQQRLRAWCIAEDVPLEVHEICLRSAPFDKVPSSEIRLLKYIEPQPASKEDWTVRQHGMPMRGPASESLRCMVRGFTESWCKGSAIEFFHNIGFSPQFEMIRRGRQFPIDESGVPLLVSVYQICKCTQDLKFESAAPLSSDHWVVEVSAIATSETYQTASSAIGSLCDRPAVSSLVKLTKPHLPPGRPPPMIKPPSYTVKKE
mmetsp:Transcript_40352/g.77131  ORF Transcript_40352/g.77131 Transcript_40352/m.77131 type:complete len:222 (+) Transcript_40352:410-1075(+)